MLKIYNACTHEVDDPDIAVGDILSQLNIEDKLLSNSLGILTCSAEHLESGVVKALCNALPFPVVGSTTRASSMFGETSFDLLALTVITSDDVTFSLSRNRLNADTFGGEVRDTFEKAHDTTGKEAALSLLLAPFSDNISAEHLLGCVDLAAPGLPCFGTVACDPPYDFTESFIICNGEHYKDNWVLVVFSGPLNVKFHTVSVAAKNIMSTGAVISDSQGNIVRKVNDKPLLEYLQTVGLVRHDGLEGVKNIPVVLRYRDGSPSVARCFTKFTSEGYAVCGGEMPEGAMFSLAPTDSADVLHTAGEALATLTADSSVKGAIILSCIGRSVLLGANPLVEAKLVAEKTNGLFPYHFLYSGGEICPVYDDEGKMLNQFHNFSFNLCVFY